MIAHSANMFRNCSVFHDLSTSKDYSKISYKFVSMGRAKRLNKSEKKQILKLKQQQLSISKISKVIKRSRKVIHNFLKNVEDYGKKKSTGRPSSLSDRDKRAILRVASNSQLTTKQIMEKSGVSASVSSVRRVLLSCKNIKRLKLKKKPPLTTKHKAERLRFAKDRVHWKKKWRRVLFSDEKNLTWMVLMVFSIIFMTQEKRPCLQFDDKWEEAA